jgi:ABC-type Fe3+-siderophore transport system permease subunit
MNGSLTQDHNSKLNWKHFLLTLLLGFLLTSFIYILFIPLMYWGLFGEGEMASRIMDRPFNSFITEFGAFILVLFICGILAFLSYRKSKISQTKSYVLTGILVSVLFILRFEIGNLIIELFQ